MPVSIAALGFVACFVIVGFFLIGVPIGAVVLRAAAKWVVKIDLSFGMAYLLILCCAIVGGAFNFCVGLAMSTAGKPTEGMQVLAGAIELPVDFIIYALAYGMFIKYPASALAPVPAPVAAPDGTLNLDYHGGAVRPPRPIGFGKGALVTLVQYLIFLAIAVVVAIVILVVAVATGYRFR